MAETGSQNNPPKEHWAKWLTDERLEVFIAVGLGLAAILTALTVYLVKVEDDHAEKSFNIALTRTTEETGAALDASEARSADETFFLDYETTRVNPHSEAGAHALLEDVARPELQRAIAWWERQRGTPGASYTPFTDDNPFYTDANQQKVDALSKEAKYEFHKAEANHDKARRLVLAGIVLATALFLYGVAGVSRRRRVKIPLTAMGYAGIFASVLAVITA